MMQRDAVAGGVFFPVDSGENPSGFNAIVYFFPRGERGAKQEVPAIVDYDHLEGSREAHGDGVVLDRAEGLMVRESVVLEIPASVAVATDQLPESPDLFKIGTGEDAELYAVKRILAKDEYLQSVLCIRRQDIRTRYRTRQG